MILIIIIIEEEKCELCLLMVIKPFVLFNNILSAAQIRLPLTVAEYQHPTVKQSVLALITVRT